MAEPTPAPVAAEKPAAPASESQAKAYDPFAFDPATDSVYDPEPPKSQPEKPAEPKPAELKAEVAKPVETPAAEPKVEAAKPATPRHDPYIERLARSFGADDAWLNANAPEFVESEVHRLIAERRAPSKPADPKEEKPVEDEIAFEFEGKKRAIKTAELDENVAALLKHFQSQNKALHEKFQHQEQTETRRRQVAAWDAIEEFFSGADQGTFGKGSYKELDQKSDEFNRRDLVVRMAKIEPTDGEKQIKQKLAAVARLFGAAPKPEAPAEKPVDRGDGRSEKGQIVDPAKAFEEQRWASNGQVKPTNRIAPELPPGTKRAEKTVAAFFKKHGEAVED